MKIHKIYIILSIATLALSSCGVSTVGKYSTNQEILKGYFSYLESNNIEKALSLGCSYYLPKDDPTKWTSVSQESNFISNNKFSGFRFLEEINDSNQQWSFKTEYFDITLNWKGKRTYVSIKNNSWSLCIDYLDFSNNDWSTFLTEKEQDDKLVSVFNKAYPNHKWPVYAKDHDLDSLTKKYMTNLKALESHTKYIPSVKARLERLNKEWRVNITYTPTSDEDKIRDFDAASLVLYNQIDFLYERPPFFDGPQTKDVVSEYIRTINSIRTGAISNISWNDLEHSIRQYQGFITYITNVNSLSGSIQSSILDDQSLKAFSRTVLLLENTILSKKKFLDSDKSMKDELGRWIKFYQGSSLISDGIVKEKTEIWIVGGVKSTERLKTYYMSIERNSDANTFLLTTLKSLSLNKINEWWVYVTKIPYKSYSEVDTGSENK